jgi:putative DNA primase/helicase
MTSHRKETGTLFDFDPEAVAAQISAQGTSTVAGQAIVPLPAPADASRAADREATPTGLLSDTLADRGNVKLFVKLYANDYRHVPGIGWYWWDTTRWQIDEDDTVLVSRR